MNILDSINSREDLLSLNKNELESLCLELREYITRVVSKNGGHLSASLGTVELTVALNRVFDASYDRILFDVGHQAYTHKILNHRKDAFQSLREFGGISGFPKPYESIADPFVAGHASDSVSVALGMARARTMMKEEYDVVAVIGDGAMTGGLSYEALCDAGQSKEPFLVVLNDNGMSINASVGGMSYFLSQVRCRPGYLNFKRLYRKVLTKVPSLYNVLHSFKEHLKRILLPPTIFDDLGFYYIGPVDGHNINELECQLQWAKELKCPVLLHVVTKKGKGISFAELNPEKYHGTGAFNYYTGEVIQPKTDDFSAVFGRKISQMAAENPKICVVTAAMCSGTGLSSFSEQFKNRFFDVGIAEEHAVAMCGGLAKQGMIPVFAVYNTFLQRAYDELIEDIALLNLHTVFCVDRSGLVGQDGETHQGSFGLAYLSSIPGMKIYSPSSFAELESFLVKAVNEDTGPVAICYARGHEDIYRSDNSAEDASVLLSGSDITLVSYGILINQVLKASERLEINNIHSEIIKLNSLSPCDFSAVKKSVEKTHRLVCVEDVCREGCMGEKILAELAKMNISIADYKIINLGSGIVQHGKIEELYSYLGMDSDSIAAAVEEMING